MEEFSRGLNFYSEPGAFWEVFLTNGLGKQVICCNVAGLRSQGSFGARSIGVVGAGAGGWSGEMESCGRVRAWVGQDAQK